MFKHKPEPIVPENTIVTSDTAHVKPAKTSKPKTLNLNKLKPNFTIKSLRNGPLVATIVIIIIAGGVFAVMQANKVDLPKSAPDASTKLYNEAQSGNKATAQKNIEQLRKYADAAKNPKDKATYRVAEAQTSLLINDYDGAKSAALDAEQAAASSDSAATLALIYKEQGDNQNAIKYYKLAAGRSPDVQDARSDRSYYLNQADLLESN